MKRIALLIACCCLLLSSSAQYYTNPNKIWVFGNTASVDFTSGLPVPFPSSIYSNEGCASVCNTAGSLLFYTDGQKVYNRLGLTMPGGSSIVPFGTGSTTQGALIVPFINDTNKYYVFSLEQYGGSGRFAYALVDMTLDATLGDIVAGSAGTIINSGMSEKMIAIPGNSCNLWVMVHKKDSAVFYAYEVTAAGLSSTPVISYAGSLVGSNSYTIGVMKCSHDRQKIALTCHIGSPSGVELFDFDPATGFVSGAQVLEFNPPVIPYGAEFSPDNTKLYTSSFKEINQWDVTLPSTSAIIASKIKVDSSLTWYSDLKLAPDGKIYYGKYSTSALDRINFPNLPGASCGSATSVVSLSATLLLGLPNVVWRVQATVDSDTVCTGSTTTLMPSVTGGTWTSSDPTIATVGVSSGIVTGVSVGTANISYTTTGGGCPETFVITVTPGVSMGGKLTLCETFSTVLSCDSTGGTWSSSSPNATVNSSGLVTGISPGTAIITYSIPGSCASSAIMTINPLPALIVGPTTVVVGSTITLTNATTGGSWTSGDSTRALPNTTGVITGVAPGTATIYYTLPTGCKQSVVVFVTSKNTVSIAGQEILRPSLYPNPATNEITVTAEPSAFTSFTIYNAIGQTLVSYEITGTQTVMNVKAYPPGEYQVIFKGNSRREMMRFVKW